MIAIGSCGIDCNECNAYIATQNDDDQLRAETAELWSKQYNVPIKPENINCTGCNEEGAKIGHCDVCQVRKCCIDKQVANCGNCDQLPCNILNDFFKMFPDGGNANMQKLKQS